MMCDTYILPRRGKRKLNNIEHNASIFFVDLTHLKERNVEDLSGGELQRFACAVVCIQKADM